MSASVKTLVNQPYKYGFTTDIETDSIARGLNEDVIRAISAKKNEPEFMLEFRLKAYRQWLKMEEPNWQHASYPPIDYQNIVYYSAPKVKDEKKKVSTRLTRHSWKPSRNWGFLCRNKSVWLT